MGCNNPLRRRVRGVVISFLTPVHTNIHAKTHGINLDFRELSAVMGMGRTNERMHACVRFDARSVRVCAVE